MYVELFPYLAHDLTLESDCALASGAADFHVVPLPELDRVLCHGAAWTISEIEAMGQSHVTIRKTESRVQNHRAYSPEGQVAVPEFEGDVMPRLGVSGNEEDPVDLLGPDRHLDVHLSVHLCVLVPVQGEVAVAREPHVAHLLLLELVAARRAADVVRPLIVEESQLLPADLESLDL